MGQESEVDLLYENLPEVFNLEQLPADWNEDWVIAPIDEPERFEEPTDLSPLFDTDNERSGWLWVQDHLPQEFSGEFAGSFLRDWNFTEVLPPDCLAFYVPFHRFYPDWWGIYLLHEGIQYLSEHLKCLVCGALSHEDCVEIARIFLFGHEQFHHAVESCSSRLEVTNRVPMFLDGFAAFYRSTRGTDDCLEETLATAHGVRRVRVAMRKAKKTAKQRSAADTALEEYIGVCPPGYRLGFDYVENEAYEAGRNELAERAHRFAVPNRRPLEFSIWTAFPRAFQPFRTRTGRINYMVGKDTPLGRRLRLTGVCFRYREVVRQFQRLAGCELVRSNGSHHIFRTASRKTISIPRHPGDIGTGLLSKIIRQAGLDYTVPDFMNA